MAVWHLKHGRWWMLQWCFAGWFSLGIHIEPRTGITTKSGFRFGPYVDLHLGPFILSLGRRPQFTHIDKWAFQGSRGGVNPVTEERA